MEMLRSVLGGSDTGPAPVSPAETIGSDLLKKCYGLELKGSEIFFDAVPGKAFTAPMPNLCPLVNGFNVHQLQRMI